jgi:hypothetical protein
MAEAIVSGTLVGIDQDVIGFAEFFELSSACGSFDSCPGEISPRVWR